MTGRQRDGKPDSKPKEAPKKPRFSEGLTIADPTRAPDTTLLRMGSFFSQTDKLPGLKAKLASCRVLHSDIDKFDFGIFVNNLQGMNKFTIADALFIAVRTTNNSFVISKVPCETLYDKCAGLMDIDLKQRVILDSGGGSGLYLYRVRGRELKSMESLSTITAPKAAPDTMVPDMSSIVVDDKEFREKLAKCEYLKGTEGGFDVAEFAAGVKFVCKYQDGHDNAYYYIQAGKDEDSYRLYVNRSNHDLTYFSEMHIFSYGKDVCRLYKED